MFILIIFSLCCLFGSLASFEQSESEPQRMTCGGEVLDAGWVGRSEANQDSVSITSITGLYYWCRWCSSRMNLRTWGGVTWLGGVAYGWAPIGCLQSLNMESEGGAVGEKTLNKCMRCFEKSGAFHVRCLVMELSQLPIFRRWEILCEGTAHGVVSGANLEYTSETFNLTV